MYQLVSRIQDGLGELKILLESHIYNQGLAAIEKCGEAALNVSWSHIVINGKTAVLRPGKNNFLFPVSRPTHLKKNKSKYFLAIKKNKNKNIAIKC